MQEGHGDSDWSTDARYDSEDIGRDIVALLQRFRPAAGDSWGVDGWNGKFGRAKNRR